MKTRYHQPEEVYAKLERAKQFETEYNMLTFDSEVESVYLYGDFSVRHSGRTEELIRDAERFHGGFELGAPLAGSRVDASDLVRAGMPFFAGKVTLYKEFELTADEAEAIRYLRFAPHGANSFRREDQRRKRRILLLGAVCAAGRTSSCARSQQARKSS